MPKNLQRKLNTRKRVVNAESAQKIQYMIYFHEVKNVNETKVQMKGLVNRQYV